MASIFILGTNRSTAALSWPTLLQKLGSAEGPRSDILVKIVDHIEGKEFEIQDIKDTFFFVTAMDKCCHHMKNFELAQRVNNMLYTGKNCYLIGDAYKESVYHRHFFCLAASTQTAERFMEIYNEMVPHVYIPEPLVMRRILSLLEVYHAVEYLPKIWSDIIIFNLSHMEDMNSLVLNCIASYFPSEENTELTKQIGEIAWDIWSRIQNQSETRTNKIVWSGKMISDVLSTLVQCDTYERTVTVFREITSNPMNFFGWASIKSLELLSKAAIDKNDTDFAVRVAIYAADAGHQEAVDLAKEITSKLDLEPQQKAKLTSALGVDIMDN